MEGLAAEHGNVTYLLNGYQLSTSSDRQDVFFTS